MKLVYKTLGYCVLGLSLFLVSIEANSAEYSQDSSSQSTDSSFKNVVVMDTDIGTFDYIDNSLILLFKFHKAFISDIDDHTCPMYPTCSTFGLTSIEKYGFFIGCMKTIDRLYRCSHDLKYYRELYLNNQVKYEDYP